MTHLGRTSRRHRMATLMDPCGFGRMFVPHLLDSRDSALSDSTWKWSTLRPRDTVCLSIVLSIGLSVYPFFCLSVYPQVPFCLLGYLPIYQSAYPSVYQPTYPSVCLFIPSVCTSVHSPSLMLVVLIVLQLV